MKQYLLEACVDSVESALAAERGGADRLELCGNLVIGGTTPEPGLFELIRENCSLPVRVLIRPRFGDFLYSAYEFELVCRAVETFRRLGADGVVVGCLTPEGDLDLERMKRLRDLAGDLRMTLHRAFDVCRDPEKVLEQAAALGYDTILTSGQQESCEEGSELIGKLVKQSAGRVEILVGGGVNAAVISRMKAGTGAASFHMSGKEVLDSGMIWRGSQVSMGIPGMNEYEIFRTAEKNIREAKAALLS